MCVTYNGVLDVAELIKQVSVGLLLLTLQYFERDAFILYAGR